MSLLHPASIAVIGASSEEGKVGHYIFQNLLTQGYTGRLYAVNPKHPEVLGQKTFPSVSAIPEAVELALIVTPSQVVTTIAEECGQKGVKILVVISAGFGELGNDEGKTREEELKTIVQKYGMQLVGPNCLGILRPSIGMNASFAVSLPQKGNIALLSQSGAMAVAIMDSAKSLYLGFSFIVSMGNKATMDECDFLEICENDPETKVIGLYLENIRGGRKFLDITKRVSQTKHIVLIKSGTSRKGEHAVSSHTGAMAGSESAIAAVCSQAGIHRAQSTQEFLDLVRTLGTQPPLLSPNIGVITNAGGPGILATDAAEKEKLMLASLDMEHKSSLRLLLPKAASVENPIDVLGDALADRYGYAVEACGRDENIDGLVVVLTPQIMTPSLEIAKTVIQGLQHYPLMPIVTCFMGDESVREAIDLLQSHGIPNFPSPERAVHALKHLQKSMVEQTLTVRKLSPERTAKAQAIIANQHGLLNAEVTKELFSLYQLPTPAQALAQTVDEAIRYAEKIGFPVVAKASSPDVAHKTDIGGVRANLMNPEDVRRAYDEIIQNVHNYDPDFYLEGILIQKFLPAGNEFIVGAAEDASFGHLIMIGLGGIYTELFNDVVFRIAPVEEKEVYAMLQGLHAWKLLMGMRGKGQSDIAALVQIVMTISDLISDCPQINELDLNPVFVDENGTVVLDAKVIIR